MPSAADYRALTWRIAQEKFGDSPLRDVFMRMIAQESENFNPEVVEYRRSSSAGAQGIAQLMPQFHPVNDPESDLRYGADLLRQNIATFGGDVAKGVAAYNAGVGGVQKAIRTAGGQWVSALPGETQAYLRIVGPEGTAPAADAGSAAARLRPTRPLTSAFGATDVPGRGSAHQGADYAYREGEAIPAFAAGVVTYAGPRNRAGEAKLDATGTGNTVVVRDPRTGQEYTYGHLSTIGVRQGQTVTPGTVIGAAGQTGFSQGAHLHFEVKGPDGKQIDPEHYFASSMTAPATAAPGRSPAVAVDPALIQERDAIRADITAIGTRIGELNDAISGKVKRSDGRPWDSEQLADFQLELKERTAALQQARNSLATYSKLISDQQQTPSSQGMTEAERATLGLGVWNAQRAERADERAGALQLAGLDLQRDQNAFARQQVATENRLALGGLAAGLIQAGFANNLAKQTFMLNALKESEGRIQAQVADAVQRGEVTFNQAATITTALATKQAAEIARVGKVAEIADWINDTDFRNMERLLPAGVTEIPGFGANSPANVVRQRLGLPPLVIEAVRVDPAKLDPRTSFADAQGLVPPVGDFEIDRQRQAYEDFQTIPKYTPTPLDPEAMVAAVGETPTFQSVWEGLPELAPYAAPADIDPALRAAIAAGGAAPGGADPRLDAFIQGLLYGKPGAGDEPPEKPVVAAPAPPPENPVLPDSLMSPDVMQHAPFQAPNQAPSPVVSADIMQHAPGINQPRVEGENVRLPDGTLLIGAAKRMAKGLIGQAALGAGRALLGGLGAR